MMETSMTYFDALNLRAQVENEVSFLNYAALERLVVFLLRSMKYRDVRIVDGGHPRGRNNYGGMSIMARFRGPIHDELALIQVKRTKLQRRYVDELGGAMQRWGAAQGIIFCTEQIPDKAWFCADQFRGRQVRLISRRHLAKLLIAHNLGVRTEPLPVETSGDLVLDEIFFRLLNGIKR
jgi:hypothetical protein